MTADDDDDDRDTGDADEAQAAEAQEPKELPPELKAVPPKEMRRLLEIATHVALRLTKSKDRADMLVSDMFIKLTTTRRWTGRGLLLDHMLGALRSELNHQYTSKAPERERAAHEGYHRDVVPLRVGSTEERMLARARAVRELAMLEARIGKHELMPKVLRCKADGIEKPADIARTLGVPAAQVYRAIELLKNHLANIRAASNDEDDGDSDEGE